MTENGQRSSAENSMTPLQGRDERHAYASPPIDLLQLKKAPSSLADFFYYRGERFYETVRKATRSSYESLAYPGLTPEQLYRLHDSVRVIDEMSYLSLTDKLSFFANFVYSMIPQSEQMAQNYVATHLRIPPTVFGYLENERKHHHGTDYVAFRRTMKIRDYLRLSNSSYIPNEFDATVFEIFGKDPAPELSLKEIAVQIKANLVGKYDDVDALKDSSLLQRVIRSRKMLVEIGILSDKHLVNRREIATQATQRDILAAYTALKPALQHTLHNLVVVTGFSETTIRKHLEATNTPYLPALTEIDTVARAYQRLALGKNHTLGEIARTTGLTEQIVRARLKALGEEFVPLSRTERIDYIASEIRSVVGILAEADKINAADIPFEQITQELHRRGIPMTEEQLDSFWNNHQHGRLLGLRLRSHAKLTNEQINLAKKLRAEGLTQQAIAHQLHTSQPVISRVLGETEEQE
ncbi:MAG TPA: hypothetical protein VFQ63_02160 [Patescibacteria group bacterium]|nr:hypothetical protein [Patescibacteria group bacterium]